eukprot:362265-Chlamydomonas_euryale.AAC.1
MPRAQPHAIVAHMVVHCGQRVSTSIHRVRATNVHSACAAMRTANAQLFVLSRGQSIAASSCAHANRSCTACPCAPMRIAHAQHACAPHAVGACTARACTTWDGACTAHLCAHANSQGTPRPFPHADNVSQQAHAPMQMTLAQHAHALMRRAHPQKAHVPMRIAHSGRSRTYVDEDAERPIRLCKRPMPNMHMRSHRLPHARTLPRRSHMGRCRLPHRDRRGGRGCAGPPQRDGVARVARGACTCGHVLRGDDVDKLDAGGCQRRAWFAKVPLIPAAGQGGAGCLEIPWRVLGGCWGGAGKVLQSAGTCQVVAGKVLDKR